MADVRDTMTERLLDDAGVGAGMRVLDVGCGQGEVSLMLARRVGAHGHVLGLDRDARALAAARALARDLGLAHVHFAEADLDALAPGHAPFDAPFDVPFDAVVGRRVLMYLPDPGAAVGRLARVLRPGGLMAFQEHDATMTPASRVPLPLHERVHGWIWDTVAREGGNRHMGFDLPAVLAGAGLTVEHARAEAVVLTPDAPYPFGAIVRAMRPRIVQHGVASEAALDAEALDTLDQRLAAERAQAGATYIGDMVFSVWARTRSG